MKDCTKESKITTQIPVFGKAVEGSEDCLHLNVYTKQVCSVCCYFYILQNINLKTFYQITDKNTELKPVMVHIFGGKFRSGSTEVNYHGPDYLLTEDIVMVIPNCRMGLLGFLSLEDPSLDVPGNAALKDQNLALQWVQKNIKHFGGDPNNVTLVGHSSGAIAVHYHFFSPLSIGLFHQIIIMSGTVFWTWTETEKFSPKLFAELLNIDADTDMEFLQQLRMLSPETIVEA